MRFEFSAEDEAFRLELRAFFARHLPRDMARRFAIGITGAIAAIMVFMRQAEHGDQRLGVALGLLGVLAVLYLSLRFAGLLQRVLRQAGIDLITRISGLLLAAIAVQLVVDAVRELARADL